MALPVPLDLPLHLLVCALDSYCILMKLVDISVCYCNFNIWANNVEDDRLQLQRFAYNVKVFMVVDLKKENDATAEVLALDTWGTYMFGLKENILTGFSAPGQERSASSAFSRSLGGG